MSAAHTAGPWRADVDYPHGPLVVNDEGTHVADYTVWPRALFNEARANARLIAAAPDLLEALRLHDVYMDTPQDRGGAFGRKDQARAAFDDAKRAAIRKATTAIEPNSVGTPQGVDKND